MYTCMNRDVGVNFKLCIKHMSQYSSRALCYTHKSEYANIF